MSIGSGNKPWALGLAWRLFSRAPVDYASALNLGDLSVSRNPFRHYERLRETGSVHYLPQHEAWIVLAYDDVQAALAQPETFSNSAYSAIDRVLLAADPPDHQRVRRVVSRVFAPQAIQRLTAYAAQEALNLLDQTLDVVGDYAVPLSARVAAELLGLDGAALAAIAAVRAQPNADTGQLVSTIDELADRCTMFPRLRDDGFDDTQARSLIRLFWLAATSTTERAIAHCVLLLLAHENMRDPDLVPPFVEEVLRLHPPELLVPRVASCDVELGGVAVPAGALIYLCLAAANRDPSKYDAPAQFRLNRPKRRMLTFGGGPHMCIGAALGRNVLQVALRTLLTAAPHFRMAEPYDGLAGWSSMTSSPVGRLVIETGLGVARRAPSPD